MTEERYVYADFNVDMIKDERTHDVLKDVDVEALRTPIRNILLTIPGTRRMQPEFGAYLEAKLFEPLDEKTAKEIGGIIINQIELWDPAIDVERVEIQVNEDFHRYEATIYFSARTANINRSSIKFILESR